MKFLTLTLIMGNKVQCAPERIVTTSEEMTYLIYSVLTEEERKYVTMLELDDHELELTFQSIEALEQATLVIIDGPWFDVLSPSVKGHFIYVVNENCTLQNFAPKLEGYSSGALWAQRDTKHTGLSLKVPGKVLSLLSALQEKDERFAYLQSSSALLRWGEYEKKILGAYDIANTSLKSFSLISCSSFFEPVLDLVGDSPKNYWRLYSSHNHGEGCCTHSHALQEEHVLQLEAIAKQCTEDDFVVLLLEESQLHYIQELLKFAPEGLDIKLQVVISKSDLVYENDDYLKSLVTSVGRRQLKVWKELSSALQSHG